MYDINICKFLYKMMHNTSCVHVHAYSQQCLHDLIGIGIVAAWKKTEA